MHTPSPLFGIRPVEHTDRLVLAAELWGGTGPGGVRFVTRCVMNLSVQELRICQVEEAHVTEVRRREPPAELGPELLGQVVNELFAVVGPASSLLLLDDLTADEPAAEKGTHLVIDSRYVPVSAP